MGMPKKPVKEDLNQRVSDLGTRSDMPDRIEPGVLFDKAPVAMLILNRDRRLCHFNEAAAAMAGRTGKTAIGLRGGEFLRCVHAFDEPKGCGYGKACEACIVRRTVLDTFKTGVNHQSVEAQISLGAEKPIEGNWVLISTTRIKLSEGERVLVSLEDISDRKRTEEALTKKKDEVLLHVKLANLFLASPGEAVFSEVLDLLRNEFNCSYGYFGYIDEAGDLICPSMTRIVWDQCRMPQKSIVFPKDCWGGLWGKSLQERISIRRNHHIVTPEGHIPLQNAIVGPLVVQNHLVGQIALANRPSGFTQKDEDKLNSIADFIAPILQIYLEKEKAQKQLLAEADKLKERNIALKVLLETQGQEKQQQVEKITRHFERLVLPYYEKLKRCHDKETRLTLLEIVEANTHVCLSTEKQLYYSSYREFTPMEVQVADLIKLGKSSKEIADLLNISPRSVYFHRNNLRRKLNIHKTHSNLKTTLISRSSTS
jgi:DNA-binding CsgD family transcriptional regulator